MALRIIKLVKLLTSAMDFCATTAAAIAFSSSSSSFLLSSFTFSRIRGIYTSFKSRAINHTRVIPPGVSLHAYLSALHANSRRSTPAGLHLQASLWLLIVDMLWYISFNAGVMWFLQQAKVNDQWGAVTPPPPPPSPPSPPPSFQFKCTVHCSTEWERWWISTSHL